MTATAMPMSSPTGAVCCSAWSTTWPRRETSMPARSVIAALGEALARRGAEVHRGRVVLDGREADAPVGSATSGSARR